MNYKIHISLSQRQLALFQDNQLVRTYPVAIGKSHSPSPTGSFKITSKFMHPGGPFGLLWLGLSAKGYGIHGTNNPASIGKFASKGCIRMYNRDVLELAQHVAIGTPVIIEK